jgi:hypothetical protein
MSSEDEVNRFMVHGVAKTDFFVWEKTHNVIREQLRGRIRFLEAQNTQLLEGNNLLQQANTQSQQKNTVLHQANTQLRQKNAELQRDYDACYEKYLEYVQYGKDLDNEIKDLKKELIDKQEWYSKLFRRQENNYQEITTKLEKYKTANTIMYELLEYIQPHSLVNTFQKISATLREVDKLVTPVYLGNT